MHGARMDGIEEACVPLPLDHFFFCFLAPVAAGAFTWSVSVWRGNTCRLRGAVPFCRMWVVRGLEGWKSLLNIKPCARSFSNVGRHVCALGLCFWPFQSFSNQHILSRRQVRLTSVGDRLSTPTALASALITLLPNVCTAPVRSVSKHSGRSQSRSANQSISLAWHASSTPMGCLEDDSRQVWQLRILLENICETLYRRLYTK